MKPIRTMADAAARVARWHNRHPLARRVTAEQVHGVGVIRAPIAVAEAPSWHARLKRLTFRPIAALRFDPQPLYRLPPRALAAWLARHGQASIDPMLGDWPQRVFDDRAPGEQATTPAGPGSRREVAVLTAALDVAGQRARVLIAPGGGAVFGTRVLSPRRALLGSALAALLGALGVVGLRPAAGPAAPAAPVLAQTAAAASAPASAPMSRPNQGQVGHGEPVPPLARSPLPGASAAATTAASAASQPAVVRPVDVPITVAQGGPPLVQIVPSIGGRPRDASRPRRPAHAASAAAPASAAVQASAASAPRAEADATWAIVTRPARSRDAAQAHLILMRGVIATTRTEQPTRLEVMRAGRQWRVAWWPHTRRDQAEEFLADVNARGLRAELVAF